MESCNVIISDLCTYRRIITFDLVSPLNERVKKKCGNPAQKERERRRESNREESDITGSLWYLLWISLRWLHCQTPESSEETQALEPSSGGGGAEVFIFHRNSKIITQQRGLDFALVQARHSSKVISYFATKALSKSLFSRWPGLEKQSAIAGIWALNCRRHLASLVDF